MDMFIGSFAKHIENKKYVTSLFETRHSAFECHLLSAAESS